MSVSIYLEKEPTKMIKHYFKVNRKLFYKVGVDVSSARHTYSIKIIFTKMIPFIVPVFCSFFALFIIHHRNKLNECSNAITIFFGTFNCSLQLIFLKMNSARYAELIKDFQTFLDKGSFIFAR